MKTTVNKKDLLKLLTNASKVAEKRNTMPVLSNVLLTVEPKRIEVQSTDLELALIQRVQCLNAENFESFKVLVNAKSILELVKSSNDTIELDKSGNDLQVNGSTITGLEPDMWPVMPTSQGAAFTFDFKDIDRVLFATSTDETRYHLNGVFIDSTSIVATDGHRLARVLHKQTVDVVGFILPTKGLKLISKLFDGPVNCIDGQYMTLTQGLGMTTLLIRKIEGRYPNYNQFIPGRFTHEIKCNRRELIQHVKSLIPLANAKSKSGQFTFDKSGMEIKNGPKIEYDKTNKKELVEISRGPVVIKKMASDYSKDCNLDALKIGFNLSYMLDALESLDGDIVTIKANDTLSPVDVICSKTQNNIVMPMRI